ncbi:MAG: Mfa1 fimbrilin C-terminal domain-containing protein [Bacteroides sp.]|nr:Mfa1 fimbrilin C-terminal domain-containing protein [Bacteroides sp.]
MNVNSMKQWKSLLVGLLAVVGMSACSDDAVEQGQVQPQGQGTPAYLTISFSTNGSAGTRSTSDTGAVNGDTDGDAEDSGHHNTGTAAENQVNQVLVVACPDANAPAADQTNVGFAKLYGLSSDVEAGVPGSDNNGKFFWVWEDKVSTSTTGTPIELAVGAYNIMVVVNPVVDLTGTGFTETDDLSEVQDLYNKILKEAYQPASTIYTGKYLAGSAEETGFMMANKAAAPITLTVNDTPDNPASLTVEVERTLSKITYRKGGLTDTGNNKTNVYEVEIETTAEAVIVDGALETAAATETTTATYAKKAFNQIRSNENGDYAYALYETAADGTYTLKGVYQETDKKVTVDGKELSIFEQLTLVTTKPTDGTTNYFIVKDTTKPEESITLVQDNIKRETYYVTLKGYTLVNLAQRVNYVRHTVTQSDAIGTPFGTLTGQNFLWTPDWVAKNAVVYNDNGEVTSNNFTNATWFHNTLDNVSAESKTMSIATDGSFVNGTAAATYYKAMPGTTNYATGEDAVTGAGSQHTDPLASIGDIMGYCLENSTDIEHQTHGLSTGISFVATVSKDQAGTQPVEALYKYNGRTYVSLSAIQVAYGATRFDADFATLIEKEKNNETITQADANKYDIVKYASNVCYYYTNEIKHFDNGNNATMGNMEFAIMRNNIYSICITNIDAIGDPYVDPVPGVDNETGKSALKLEVRILPWIVRYNDIDF